MRVGSCARTGMIDDRDGHRIAGSQSIDLRRYAESISGNGAANYDRTIGCISNKEMP